MGNFGNIMLRAAILLPLLAPGAAFASGKCDNVKDILRSPDSRAYRVSCIYGDDKVPFRKFCSDKDSQPHCRTGQYLHKSDYFIAVPDDSGAYCAALIPDGYMKPKAVGFIDIDERINDGLEPRPFSADIAAVKSGGSEDGYSALHGLWADFKSGVTGIASFSFSDSPDYIYLNMGILRYRRGQSGAGVASASYAPLKQARVLRTGEYSYAAVSDNAVYDISVSHNGENADASLHISEPESKAPPESGDNMSGEYSRYTCSSVNDVITYNPRSFKVLRDMSFSLACLDGEKRMCPVGARVEKGSYILASPLNAELLCAAYIPNGYQKPRAVGIIKNGSAVAETPEAEYADLLGGWQPARGLNMSFTAFYRTRNTVKLFDYAPVEMASRISTGYSAQYASVLKTGDKSYLAFGMKKIFDEKQPEEYGFHDIFLREDALHILPAPSHDFDGDYGGIDEDFSASGYKKSYSAAADCSRADAAVMSLFDGRAHSYKAARDIPVSQPCPSGDGYCNMGKFIKKGGYFIASKYDGSDSYCAVQTDEKGGGRQVTFGRINGGGFAEIPAKDYKPLRLDFLWKPQNAAAFKEHGYLEFQKRGYGSDPDNIEMQNNSTADMTEDEFLSSGPDILTERDMRGSVLKSGADSFIAVTYHGLYHISVKGKRLSMRGIYSIDKDTDTGDDYSGAYILNRENK